MFHCDNYGSKSELGQDGFQSRYSGIFVKQGLVKFAKHIGII